MKKKNLDINKYIYTNVSLENDFRRISGEPF